MAYIPGDSTQVSKDIPALEMKGFPAKRATKTLISGAGVVEAGTILGEITASRKLQPCLTSASDGSEVPYAIAMASIDATSADKSVPVSLTGEFRALGVKYGGTPTDAQKAELVRLAEDRNIYINTVSQA